MKYIHSLCNGRARWIPTIAPILMKHKASLEDSSHEQGWNSLRIAGRMYSCYDRKNCPHDGEVRVELDYREVEGGDGDLLVSALYHPGVLNRLTAAAKSDEILNELCISPLPLAGQPHTKNWSR